MVVICVRKLMLVMMEMLILILLSVRANNRAPTSFSLSPPPILPPYYFELGDGVIKWCLTNGVEEQCASIKGPWPFPDLEYEICIDSAFKHCLGNYVVLGDKKVFFIIKDCIHTNCHPKLKIRVVHRRSARYVSCLLECYVEHVKTPSNVTHTQNP